MSNNFGVPDEEISCPGCGRKYGHHNTKVDIYSEECSSCVKDFNRSPVELIPADEFITKYLGYNYF